MASVRKRKDKYVVIYDYISKNGERKQKWESFSTKPEANKRAVEIEHEKINNSFITPSDQTVEDFLKDWVDVQAKAKWQYKTLMSSKSIIEQHIVPAIGKVKMQKITPRQIDMFFNMLRTKRVAGSKSYNKAEEDIPFLSSTSIRHIYTLLKSAFDKAVDWKILTSNPVVCDPPQRAETERKIWDIDTMRLALSEIKDENLHLALHMAFVCSLRIGEAMAATWDCIDLDKGEFRVTKTLQRATKEAIDMLPKDNLFFIFPAKMEDKKSVLILKKPKTKASTRMTYLTTELVEELRQHKAHLDKRKEYYGDKYRDYNMVFALEDGYPVEPKLCEKWFKQWMEHSEYDYPDIVFHSIRHSSTTYKLIISGGDIKAVQGDTGHATADMVVNQYSHIQDQTRRTLTNTLEKEFYTDSESSEAADEDKNTSDINSLLDRVKNDPELQKKILDELRCEG